MELSSLLSHKENIEPFAAALSGDDIKKLTALLNEKNDALRYPAFLALQARSRIEDDVYPYFDDFVKRLSDKNSFQRNIGLNLLAENVRWDKENRFLSIYDEYMSHCTDEKFITCRQAIGGIPCFLPYLPQLWADIARRLMAIDISLFRESQQKLILIDILNILLQIRRGANVQGVDEYILYALDGGLLDRKTKKTLEARFYAPSA